MVFLGLLTIVFRKNDFGTDTIMGDITSAISQVMLLAWQHMRCYLSNSMTETGIASSAIGTSPMVLLAIFDGFGPKITKLALTFCRFMLLSPKTDQIVVRRALGVQLFQRDFHIVKKINVLCGIIR